MIVEKGRLERRRKRVVHAGGRESRRPDCPDSAYRPFLVSCHVANVGTESDAVLDRQGVATRHSGGYGEETQHSRSG